MTTTAAPTVRPTPSRGCWRSLPANLDTPAAARRLVADLLARWGAEDLESAAVLIVSELITNAVVHTGCRSLGLAIRLDDRTLRLGVRDSSAAFPCVLPLTGDLPNGRGLAIVAALSTTWGCRPAPYGKVVWAELARPVAEPRQATVTTRRQRLPRPRPTRLAAS